MTDAHGLIVGWTANVLLVVAFFLIGRKWRHAFLLTFAGEVLWGVESWRIGRPDMLTLCVIFAALALKNWWGWRAEEVSDSMRDPRDPDCISRIGGALSNALYTLEPHTLPSGFTTKDSGERMEFAGGMQRDTNAGKILWHLVAAGPLLKRWAELLTRGAEKYTPNNWMKADGPEELERFRESAFRHFMQWYLGEGEEDHGAAVVFNINGAEFVKDRLKAKESA